MSHTNNTRTSFEQKAEIVTETMPIFSGITLYCTLLLYCNPGQWLTTNNLENYSNNSLRYWLLHPETPQYQKASPHPTSSSPYTLSPWNVSPSRYQSTCKLRLALKLPATGKFLGSEHPPPFQPQMQARSTVINFSCRAAHAAGGYRGKLIFTGTRPSPWTTPNPDSNATGSSWIWGALWFEVSR